MAANRIKKEENKTGSGRLNSIFKKIGPGLVTGASDDDPSGIATYSQAGAGFGYRFLWTAIATWPLMVNIQEMCARIGIVTNAGLARVIRRHYPRWLGYFILSLSMVSITINIGADIAGMGAVGNMLIPAIPGFVFSILFSAVLLYAIIFWKYRKLVKFLKWLCICLFAYLVIPFLSDTDWKSALSSTLLPEIEFNSDYLMMLVAILGTTISPYLFFWQATMEAEEAHHEHIVVDKKVISEMRQDVRGGMALSNLVFYFIILTTGTVLFNAGIHQIQSVEEAAAALKPLAGNRAYILFAIGILGTGALTVPVLAGSLGYMMSESFGWKKGLDKTFTQAKEFYITMVIATLVGLGIHLTGIQPIKALLWAAVTYGVAAPVIIALILHICNQKKIMNEYVNTKWQNMLGGIAFTLMALAVLSLIWSLF